MSHARKPHTESSDQGPAATSDRALNTDPTPNRDEVTAGPTLAAEEAAKSPAGSAQQDGQMPTSHSDDVDVNTNSAAQEAAAPDLAQQDVPSGNVSDEDDHVSNAAVEAEPTPMEQKATRKTQAGKKIDFNRYVWICLLYRSPA